MEDAVAVGPQEFKISKDSHKSGTEWRHWREKVPPDAVKEASPVFIGALDKAAQLRAEMKDTISDPNRMVVVVSAYNASDVLPETIRELVGQMRDNDRYGEIFVVLNNGGGNTKDIVPQADAQKDKLKSEWRVDQIQQGRVVETTSKDQLKDRSKPKAIQLDTDIVANKGISVIFINQDERPDNDGKALALRDIYPFLHKQHVEHNYNARDLFAIDAETRIRRVDPDTHEVIPEYNIGLAHMLAMVKEKKAIVGAKNALIPYTEKGNPDWGAKTPPMQTTINVLHGTAGFDWLPGGATLGKFTDIVPMMEALTQAMPGNRVEDVTMTVMARTLGLPTIVDTDVVHANRSPRFKIFRRQGQRNQMVRWKKGLEGVMKIGGKKLTETVVNDNIVNILFTPLTEAYVHKRKIDIPHLMKAFPSHLRRSLEAKLHPDDFISGKASWIPGEKAGND